MVGRVQEHMLLQIRLNSTNFLAAYTGNDIVELRKADPKPQASVLIQLNKHILEFCILLLEHTLYHQSYSLKIIIHSK